MIKYFTPLKRIDVTFRDVFIEIICTRKMAMPENKNVRELSSITFLLKAII